MFIATIEKNHPQSVSQRQNHIEWLWAYKEGKINAYLGGMILRHFLGDYSLHSWIVTKMIKKCGEEQVTSLSPAEPVYHTAITTQQLQLRTDLAPDEKHPEPSSQSPFCLDMVLVVQRLEWIQQLVLSSLEPMLRRTRSVLTEDTNGLRCRQKRLWETELETGSNKSSNLKVKL